MPRWILDKRARAGNRRMSNKKCPTDEVFRLTETWSDRKLIESLTRFTWYAMACVRLPNVTSPRIGFGRELPSGLSLPSGLKPPSGLSLRVEDRIEDRVEDSRAGEVDLRYEDRVRVDHRETRDSVMEYRPLPPHSAGGHLLPQGRRNYSTDVSKSRARLRTIGRRRHILRPK